MESTSIHVLVLLAMRAFDVRPKPTSVPRTLVSTRGCAMIWMGATGVTVCQDLQVS